MDRLAYVYRLIDPFTFETRYIGITRIPEDRLSKHIYEMKRVSTHKNNWIKRIVCLGKRPILEVIETTIENLASERERVWIAYFKRIAPLTNLTNGGEGQFHHAVETIERIREKNKRYRSAHPIIFSEGLRHKLSEAQKKRIREGRSNILELAKARIGKPFPESARKKLSEHYKGKPSILSPDGRRRLSEAAKKQWQDPHYRQLMHESGVRHTAKPEVMGWLGKRPRYKRIESGTGGG